MSAWLEVWSRPGDAAYGRRIADLPFLDASADVVYSGVGKGSMRLPSNYSRLDEILLTDPVTPANNAWSTIKVVSEDGVLYEWLPSPRVPDGDKAQTAVDFAGDGIEQLWGWARVEPWDWDGSTDFVSTFPNWIWGGRNLLTNPGFEDSGESPIIDELWIDGASGGTYFLSDGTNNTSAIAYNENNPAVIEAELESASPSPIYDDCLVAGTGTVDDPFVIEAVDPFEGVTLTVGTGLLVGGTADIRRVQFGSLQPTGWTRSTTVSSGSPRNFGSYTSFRVSAEQAHSGTYSLRIDPAQITGQGNRYPGAQQVIRVKPGGTYQASIWLRSSSATTTFRFVIRGIDGDFIKSSSGGLSSFSVAANTWTQVTIPDVLVGDNSQIIFRIAVTNPPPFNPPVWYIDDAVFAEGLAPTTAGAMLEAFYEDATVDHVADGRLVWEDEANPGTPYLTLGFDAVNDSDGAAWDRDDLSLTFRPRMSYLQVLSTIVAEGNYEWELVADSSPGTYVLEVYNPGTLGSSVAAGIVGGSSDSRRQGRYFAPTATDIAVQGALETSSRASDAGLVAAFGRIEGALLDQDLTSLGSIQAAAGSAVAENRNGAESLVYTLQAPKQKPLGLYRPGDTITVNDPPLSAGARRVSSIQITMSKAQVDEYVVSLSDSSPFRNVGGLMLQRGLTGPAATDNAVAALLKAYRKADELPGRADLEQATGGGGMASVLVVDDFASDFLKSKADYIIESNNNATVDLQGIIDTIGQDLQTIWVHGYLTLETALTLPSGVQIIGLSASRNSYLDFQGGSITLGAGCLLRDLSIQADCSADVIILGSDARAQNLELNGVETSAGSIFSLGSDARVSDIWVQGGESGSAGALVYLDSGSWQQVSGLMVNNFAGGAVIRADNCTQFVIADLVTQACEVDLILDTSFEGSISGWQSTGAGDGTRPVVLIEDSSGITFSACHWEGPTPGSTGEAGIYVLNSEYVSIDVSNQFSDFQPAANDRGFIILEGSIRCTISPMFIGLAGGTVRSDIDFVRLLNADNNFVSYGHYLPYGLFATGNQPRHGIIIDASSADNTVVGNQMVPAARFTGNVIQDNGTGTVLLFPADATYGDNFT